MSNLLIHSTEIEVPKPFACISCDNFGLHEQYRVHQCGTVFKWGHSFYQGYDWYELDSNEPNYEEIKKIGLELLG